MKNLHERTAQDFANCCRAVAKAENRWTDGECNRCYMGLNKDGECNECLDDAHEAWLMTRKDI